MLVDLARKPLQRKPYLLLIHLVDLVQEQLRDGNRLQVAVATRATDVERVGPGLFQVDRVRVGEDLGQLGTQRNAVANRALEKSLAFRAVGKT